MVSSKRGAFSLRAARPQGEALARVVAVKAEVLVLEPELVQVVDLAAVPVADLVLARVADLVVVPELELVAVLVADRGVVLLQWPPAR
jgi:hypothetical protein